MSARWFLRNRYHSLGLTTGLACSADKTPAAARIGTAPATSFVSKMIAVFVSRTDTNFLAAVRNGTRQKPMRNRQTKQMQDHWLDLLRDKNGNLPETDALRWPDRADIQPANCRSLLGDMFILDVADGIRYRLAGTRLCTLYDREMKGDPFSALFSAADRKAVEDCVRNLDRERTVALISSSALNTEGKKLVLETLLLPLTSNGRGGTRVLGITTPAILPDWAGRCPLIGQRLRNIRESRPWEPNNRQLNTAAAVPFGPTNADDAFSPLVFSASPPLAPNHPEQTTSWPEMKRVAHLLVIDGGRVE